jgi:hypothetical protein
MFTFGFEIAELSGLFSSRNFVRYNTNGEGVVFVRVCVSYSLESGGLVQ